MAELVDALDSGSSRGNSVDVRLILAAMTPPLNMFAETYSVALVANGAIHDFAFIASLVRTYERCVAVDGGLLHCRAMGILPDLILGDFDSTPPGLLAAFPHIPTLRFPENKEETDLQLAIETIENSGKKKIGIFGALSKRADHGLANLYQLSLHGDHIVMETERETLFVVKGSRHIPCFPGQTVSLIPLGLPARGVTTQGLKWELHKATLDPASISISNICLGEEFAIDIESGSVICFKIRSDLQS